MTRYLPIVRSRAAELRGLKELSQDARLKLLPIIELTKSRRTSKNPAGNVAKSVEAVLEILGKQPFIVDLTSLESQQNTEFDNLLDDQNGFSYWTEFAVENLPAHCVPVVHLLEPFDAVSFRRQIASLGEKFKKFAVRVPTNYSDFDELVGNIPNMFGRTEDVVLILDAAYVSLKGLSGANARLAEMLGAIDGIDFFAKSIAASSFPISVVSAGGGDEEGEFNLTEVELWSDLSKRFSGLDYSDYAGIHPMDFSGTVTNWVPRIDVMLDRSFFYHRYRRTEGGYVKCAQRAIKDPRFVPLDCWAVDNIRKTADGEAIGRSPSFWISNRVNFHISRQVIRVSR